MRIKKLGILLMMMLLLSMVTTAALGTLVIKSEPYGAKVYIDGKETHKSTSTAISLTSGNHTYKLVREGYFPYNETIKIGDNEILNKNIKLKQISTYKIDSSPQGAKVYINGIVRGKTPLEIKNLEAGEYNIKLTHNTYFDYTKVTKLKGGKTSEKIYLKKNTQKGHLRIKPTTGTTPIAAKIYLNELYRGRAEILNLKNLNPGIYALRISREGYKDTVQLVQVKSNQTVTLDPKISK